MNITEMILPLTSPVGIKLPLAIRKQKNKPPVTTWWQKSFIFNGFSRSLVLKAAGCPYHSCNFLLLTSDRYNFIDTIYLFFRYVIDTIYADNLPTVTVLF